MTEKPREYKRRVDAEWRKNERNKNKLIKKIKEYELLDESYKEGIEAEILEVFSKKEKEGRGEEYENIVKVIEDVDKKYEDLNKQRADLMAKEREEQKIMEEMEQCELDAEDNTTLNKQWRKIEELEEMSKKLKFEIEEMKKEISDKEEEIRVIEENYGKKEEEESVLETSEDQEGDTVQTKQAINLDEVSLKQFREETIKDLWGKDRKRLEIIKILEEGAGIGDKLSEKIEREVTDRFFEYYNESLGNIDMEVASFLRNALRKKEGKYEEIKAMVDGEEKQKKLEDLERAENAFGRSEVGIEMWREMLKKELSDGFSDIKELGKFGGKPIFEAKYRDGNFRVYRGDEQISGWYKKRIGKIQEIGGKPVFVVKNRYGKFVIYRGDICCCSDYKIIGKVQDIGGKPFFKVVDFDGDFCVYRGNHCIRYFKKIGKIQEIGGKPFFEVENSFGERAVYRGDIRCCGDHKKIWNVQEIGGKPAFKVKYVGGAYKVYRGYDVCGRSWSWIGKVKDRGGEPAFQAMSSSGGLYNVKGYDCEPAGFPVG